MLLGERQLPKQGIVFPLQLGEAKEDVVCGGGGGAVLRGRGRLGGDDGRAGGTQGGQGDAEGGRLVHSSSKLILDG